MTISSVNPGYTKISRPNEPKVKLRLKKDNPEEKIISDKAESSDEISTAPTTPVIFKTAKKNYRTLAESTKQVTEKHLGILRNFGLASATILGVSASSLAFLARIFSKAPDRKDSFAKKFEPHAKRCTATSYGIFALIRAVKAIRQNDFGLLLTNLLEMPISFFSSTENLTLNRGISIGLGNIVTEASRICSREKYNNFGESVNYLMKALDKVYKSFKADPFKAITDMRHGTGSIFFAGITALSPLLKQLTGSDLIAYNFRHWPGIIQEFGKINLVNLKKGAFNYWTSGVMMLLSSSINLLGGTFKELKHSTEILTWIPNVFGRRLLAAADIHRETSKDRLAPSLSMISSLKLAANEILHRDNGKFHNKVAHAAA